MKKFNGKTCLITGGAAGIGLATAHYFGKAGCELILTDLDEHSLENAAKELRGHGYSVHTLVNDVSDRKAVFELADDVLDQFGCLDILINNAGIGHHAEMKDTTIEQWDKLIDVNLKGPLNFIYAFLPSMLKSECGHVVNVSSGQAFLLLPTWGAYASIKAAVGAFSEVMHYELARHKIKVTTVYPYMVNTGFYDEVEGDSWGSKMSMQLLPYYSNSPETVGKIIFKAVKKNKKVEMVHPINSMGFYSRAMRPVHSTISIMANWFLAGKKEEA